AAGADFASASASSIARMATSMTLRRVLPGLVLLLSFAGAAMGGLPTVAHEGRDYVELVRAAELLKTRLEATPNGTQARLRPSGHVVILTRNWSRILIDGSPLILDAPVRVRRGVWLVPDTFVAQVLPRVQSAAAASPPTSTPAVPVAMTVPAAPVTLEELRVRSYPLFTRIVLETSGAVTARVETSAGHGGTDSGAVGPGGLQEKDLVLDVTRRVARLVEERLGVKAVLSRDGDHFVPLRDRTSFANKERADLFVSIHANAHRETASTG